MTCHQHRCNLRFCVLSLCQWPSALTGKVNPRHWPYGSSRDSEEGTERRRCVGDTAAYIDTFVFDADGRHEAVQSSFMNKRGTKDRRYVFYSIWMRHAEQIIPSYAAQKQTRVSRKIVRFHTGRASHRVFAFALVDSIDQLWQSFLSNSQLFLHVHHSI